MQEEHSIICIRIPPSRSNPTAQHNPQVPSRETPSCHDRGRAPRRTLVGSFSPRQPKARFTSGQVGHTRHGAQPPGSGASRSKRLGRTGN
ncbi:hypothetical protein B0O80DRAFT_434773 [Mortierella sp. GBAus27b]|nr:hypothetical protein B0O80DRAFT_434773 [Mortierella sp. GBAus27b]